VCQAEFIDLRTLAGVRKNNSQVDQCGLIFARDPYKPGNRQIKLNFAFSKQKVLTRVVDPN
jgi:hypothetical protein